MAETADSPVKSSGCGFLSAVFGRRSFWLRRTTSTGSLPSVNNSTSSKNSGPGSKRRRGNSDEANFLDHAVSSAAPPRPGDNQMVRPPTNSTRAAQNQGGSDDALTQSSLRPSAKKMPQMQPYVNQGRKLPKEAVGISGELDAMIADSHRSKGNSTLVRASSSNVMLFGNLGNLRQPGGGGGGGNQTTNTVLDYLPKTAREQNPVGTPGNIPNSQPGNAAAKKPTQQKEPALSACRALSTRMDPETLKTMGNEDYKNGRFEDALALYDAAISIDPNKASYRSNRSAALTALGRLLEAVFECREAIRIEPYYHRAHQRLGNLYVRLGEVEKAIYHFKHAGPETDPESIAKANSLQQHLGKCAEARRLRDWNALVREAAHTISSGADSAPQIYSLQAEALLKLNRHQEADVVLASSPDFNIDDCTKFFGPYGNANLLMIRAQVDLAAGRLDEAFEAAQKAARLDSNSKEVGMVVKRARAVMAARSKGNDLFKAAKFPEACIAYGEGLDHDPFNSVLLCNRAACLAKLGHFDRAVEDCTAALIVRPSYTKARLRRADCYAKLGKWGASVGDYEVLMRESPDDEETGKAMFEAKLQLKKQRGEDVSGMKYRASRPSSHDNINHFAGSPVN